MADQCGGGIVWAKAMWNCLQCCGRPKDDLFRGLSDAAARGWNFGLHSSWCEESTTELRTLVARVRPPGARGPGEAKVGNDIGELVGWILEKARAIASEEA